MQNMYNKLKIASLIGEIMTLSVLLTETSEADVFCEYSGHIKELQIRIYANGWIEKIDSDIKDCCYSSKTSVTDEKIIKRLEKMRRQLANLVRKNKVDLSCLPYREENRIVKTYNLVG